MNASESNDQNILDPSNKFKIFFLTSPDCFDCPRVFINLKEAVKELKKTTKGINFPQPTIKIIDITEKPDLAEKLQVLAVPTIIIENLHIMGFIEKKELVGFLHQVFLSDFEMFTK